jgi:hypothetical protein
MGRICDWKFTFAELPVPEVGFPGESAVAATAEEFVTTDEFVAPGSSALEVEGTLVPAFVWAQP